MKTTNSKRPWLEGPIGCALAVLALGTGRAIAADASVTAIDILLKPDATMRPAGLQVHRTVSRAGRWSYRISSRCLKVGTLLSSIIAGTKINHVNGPLHKITLECKWSCGLRILHFRPFIH